MWLEIALVTASVLAFAAYQFVGRFAGHVLYVTVSIDAMTLRDVTKSISMTLNAADESLAYSHPRALVGNFTNAELLLKSLTKKMGGFTTPSIVIHPLARIEGGLTQIEERAIQELAHGAANGRKVFVHTGAQLTDAEVIQKVKSGR